MVFRLGAPCLVLVNVDGGLSPNIVSMHKYLHLNTFSHKVNVFRWLQAAIAKVS